jgi:hypothetical protein
MYVQIISIHGNARSSLNNGEADQILQNHSISSEHDNITHATCPLLAVYDTLRAMGNVSLDANDSFDL